MIHPASFDALQSAARPQRGAAAKETAGSPGPPALPAQREESVRAAAAAINRAAKALNNNVELSLDSESGRAIVRVLDSETGQLIRQIPSEEVLELRRALDRIAGLIIHRTA
ncbi:MAG: flagellar protein FlaG [Burkholderiales bacterium]|nr:flagellar protein FlaG [Burkholderiales bacterium]